MTTADEVLPSTSLRRLRRNRGLSNPEHITANVTKEIYDRLDAFARSTGTDIGLAAALRIVMDVGLKAKGF